MSKGVKPRQLSNHFNSVSTGKAVIPLSINASIKNKTSRRIFLSNIIVKMKVQNII
jgi:hypothetical protein